MFTCHWENLGTATNQVAIIYFVYFLCALKRTARLSDWLIPRDGTSPGTWCLAFMVRGLMVSPPTTGDRTRGAGLERSPLRRHFNLGNDET